MNDDLVVQKILKLLENNTAFIGYALNGGIGTKINVRNTETGKTIQAESINVDSSGEVLVVKDSEDGKYKAVTFKSAGQTTERIIQLRNTKPTDNKKIIDYTDSDIEVFYLFVKLIDTGSPVESQLTSTWIRKGSSCTQFVGAYERCNYAAKETIGGTSYTGLPYKPYSSLNDCLNDDLGRDAKTPHGSGDSNGVSPGWKIYSTVMTAANEEALRAALESHDLEYGTSYKKLFGYGSILECSGAMYVEGWHVYASSKNPGQNFLGCDFGYLPGFTSECSLEMRNAGYCDNRGFINSKTPPPGTPGVGSIDNSWAYEYGWIDYSYDFMYKRHFIPLYLDGASAKGSFLILEVNDDQTPTIPDGYFPWTPGCPSNLGDGGPYNGGGGNRFPDGPTKPKKRDMKLSTHKAEIWLGSSKKEEAIKLYELGASDLFSGMYNSFILAANESTVDSLNRVRSTTSPTLEETFIHETFYKNWNKNIIDLRIDPRVWIYTIDNIPKATYVFPNIEGIPTEPRNESLQKMIDHIYNRTLNLTIVDKKTQIIHLKLGLTPKGSLSNTDCKGNISGSFPISQNDFIPIQNWEYQKSVTIKIKNWEIESIQNTLNANDIPNSAWNKEYIEKKIVTSFGQLTYGIGSGSSSFSNVRDIANNLLLRSNISTSRNDLLLGNHYEQYNYTQATSVETTSVSSVMNVFVNSYTYLQKPSSGAASFRRILQTTSNWWALWDRSILNNKRFSCVVGYDLNYHQIMTNYGLNANLNYTAPANNNQAREESYFEYMPSRPKIYIPSTIRSVRNKTINLEGVNNQYAPLISRNSVLSKYGLNNYSANMATLWSRPVTAFRLDGRNTPFIPVPSTFYSSNYGATEETLDDALYNSFTTGNYIVANNRRIHGRRWFNRLWVQFIYDGSINVDVDSYKNVEFSHPENPSQYIKYALDSIYANSEYPFVIRTSQDLETVLTPGVLDVTKQVPIKKPTNVELDPNYSFLVYIYPFVSVTKKTKEI